MTDKCAVIFDFGGVLVRTVDYGPRHAWDARLGLPPGSVERVVHGLPEWRAAQTGTLPLDAYWQAVAHNLGLSASDIRQLAIDFYSGDALDTTVVDYVHTLRRDGHPVGLLSNDSPALQQRLDTLGITHLFDPLIISALIGVMKPDPAAYRAALRGRSPEKAIFIDDLSANIEGARAVGIHGILYKPGMDLPAAVSPLLV